MYIYLFSVFKALISMLIYGMVYFPLFASLALESALGYCVGTAYAWLLFIVEVFQIFECPMPLVSIYIYSQKSCIVNVHSASNHYCKADNSDYSSFAALLPLKC